MSPAKDQSRTASSEPSVSSLWQAERDRRRRARDPPRDEALGAALGLVVVDDPRARVQAVVVAHRADELVRGELGDRVRVARAGRRELVLRALRGVAEDRSGGGRRTRGSRGRARAPSRAPSRSRRRSRRSPASGRSQEAGTYDMRRPGGRSRPAWPRSIAARSEAGSSSSPSSTSTLAARWSLAPSEVGARVLHAGHLVALLQQQLGQERSVLPGEPVINARRPSGMRAA